MKILVADDEPHITHMLRFLFEKRGHEVVVADNGEAALEQSPNPSRRAIWWP